MPEITGVREGDVLVGKYRIDRILGAGGMGVVVAAHHIHLDERVAIKFLLPEMMQSGEAVARFTREARAAVKIKSEHVARVSDVGTLDNGAPYMVMEYLEGSDLSAWIKQRGALPVDQAVDFVLQACEAIAEAHTLGIVHRDLKPANLFVIRRPEGALSVKVLDFGISKMRGGSNSVPDVSITKTQAMMGSPLYMSPEQMQSSKDVDARTDIWALGIILFELLTGYSPFVADTMPELVAKILSMPPPRLRAALPTAPEGLELALSRCLEKDRNRRFESVAEFAVALAPFAPKRARLSLDRISGVMGAAGFHAAATALPPSSDPVQAASIGGTQGAFGKTSAPRSKTAVTLGAAGLVLALGAGAFVIFGRQPQSGTEALSAAPPAPATTPEARPSEKVEVLAPAPAPMLPVATPAPSASEAAPPPPSVAPVAASPRTRAIPARSRAKATPSPAAAAPSPASPPPQPVAPKGVPTPKAPGAFDDRK